MIVVNTPAKINVTITGPGVNRTITVAAVADAVRFAAIQAMFNRIYLGGI